MYVSLTSNSFISCISLFKQYLLNVSIFSYKSLLYFNSINGIIEIKINTNNIIKKISNSKFLNIYNILLNLIIQRILIFFFIRVIINKF